MILTVLVTVALSQGTPAEGISRRSVGTEESKQPTRQETRKPLAAPAEPREDDAEAREKAMELRHGGKPSLQYIEGKERILRAESRKWTSKRPFNLPLGATPPVTAGGSWVNLGPGSLDSGAYSSNPADLNSGRLTAIVSDPTSATTLYVATAGGGVWKCSNADLSATGDWTWSPITDSLPAAGVDGNIPVGDLAMDPGDPHTLYLGLGDPLGAGKARGFWITHDGGSTWSPTQTPLPWTETRRILPLGGGVVIYLAGGQPGSIERSTDGASTFSSIVPKAGQLSIYDIRAFSASELALIGSFYDSAGMHPLFMYSSDGGVTWSDATIDDSVKNIPIQPISGTLACSQTGDGVGYALVPNASSGLLAQGLVTTANNGHSWTFRASSQLFSASGDGNQVSYNLFLTVDPDNSQHVFAGANAASYRSLDGGQTWTQMTNWYAYEHVYAHADFHVGAWSKTGTKTLFTGTDGGLTIFLDPLRASVPYAAGKSVSDLTFVDNRRNRGIASHLLYSVGSTQASNDPQAANFLLVGMQDNSTGTRLDATSTFQLDPSTGDGMAVLLHPLDAHKALATSYGNVYFHTEQFGTSHPAWSVIQPSRNVFFFTPLSQMPTDPDGVVTCAANGPYTSRDFGQTFTSVPTTGLTLAYYSQRVAASPFYPNALAFTSIANPNGAITLDGGSTWKPFGPLQGSGTPYGSWDITFSTSDPSTLFLTTQTYDLQSSHIFKSTDLGATWSSIDGSSASSNGYPFGIPANVIRESPVKPGTLYVGTEIGVYVSEDGGSTWSRLGNGLPFMRVEDLYLAPDGSFLRAATYGRGVWEVPLSTASAFALTTAYLPSGTLNTPYLEALAPRGGIPPYSLTITAGSLPPGLALSGDETISGTPTTAGHFAFSIGSVDSSSPTPLQCRRSYGISVSADIQVQGGVQKAGLLTGRTATFSATAINTSDPSVIWTASGGTLNQSTPNEATFSASVPGSYTLKATSTLNPGASFSVNVLVHSCDYTGPGQGVTGTDALYVIGRFGGSDLTADLNGDGQVDQTDLDQLLTLLGW